MAILGAEYQQLPHFSLSLNMDYHLQFLILEVVEIPMENMLRLGIIRNIKFLRF
jgi:hypothetical protein